MTTSERSKAHGAADAEADKISRTQKVSVWLGAADLRPSRRKWRDGGQHVGKERRSIHWDAVSRPALEKGRQRERETLLDSSRP